MLRLLELNWAANLIMKLDLIDYLFGMDVA